MSAKDTGGPAFPCDFENDSDVNLSAPNGCVVAPGAHVAMPGLSVRDYFAAKAMQTVLTLPCTDPNAHQNWVNECARLAYLAADAMLQERAK